ncbi:MAG TPA: SMP-30/gluconolactonase/LRE family protein [Limnochordia bacterium]|nr:SMP-30/gluconolactonase/LRE family protein [Limnochordia bacterium]
MSEAKPFGATQAILGEGALWYGDRLYWIDIEGKRVYIDDVAAGTQAVLDVPERVGTVVPRAKGGLVVALANGFAFLDERTGAVTPITDPEPNRPDNRFNDGKCDPAGRFWAGTMSVKESKGAGALYMLDRKGVAHRKLDDVSVSNGICWSHDKTKMYYVDTPTQQVVTFDYDDASGEIKNPRVKIAIDPAEGHPDGMTIDADGNLWIALWQGYAVVAHDPRTGKRLHKIELPVAKVTSCAFGGLDLADLYITSASIGLSAEERAKQPLAGSLFLARPGARGVPAFAYAG